MTGLHGVKDASMAVMHIIYMNGFKHMMNVVLVGVTVDAYLVMQLLSALQANVCVYICAYIHAHVHMCVRFYS